MWYESGREGLDLNTVRSMGVGVGGLLKVSLVSAWLMVVVADAGRLGVGGVL